MDKSSPPHAALATPAAPVPGRIPVLIVDDRPENLVALEALLDQMPLPLELVKAASGHDALRQSLRRDFALVLLDVQMPDMDGIETATLLRASPKTCHLPIIFITAGMHDQVRQFQGYETGAVDFLTKPIEPLVLRNKVAVFCELYSQCRELEQHKAGLEAKVAARTAELSALALQLGEEVKARRASEQALSASEVRLRIANEQLEAKVEARTGQLRQAMDQIVESEKLASLGSIVAGVAHELNTPIGNLVLLATALKERITDLASAALAGKLTRSMLCDSASACQDASDVLVRSADRARELVESFKSVAVDQTSQRRRQFDLRRCAEDIVATLGGMVRRARAQIQIRVPAGIVMDSFPGHMEQILSNLIINSLLHGFEGRDGGKITVEARCQGEMVHIVYQDDGVGIAPNLQRKVFEPFYTTKLGCGGSGLGMFIVHNLVHGVLRGEIALESSAGQGVRFTIVVPRDTP